MLIGNPYLNPSEDTARTKHRAELHRRAANKTSPHKLFTARKFDELHSIERIVRQKTAEIVNLVIV